MAAWQTRLVKIHPGGFRLVLVGPKVSRMLPFLQERGFVGEAFAGGKPALECLRRSPCHVLCIEVELGDMMGVDLARIGKAEHIVGATLLLEDPIKSGMVISALARGIEAFVPVPPDEALLMDRLELLLLAQWGVVVAAQIQQLNEEVGRLSLQLSTAQGEARSASSALVEFQKTASRDLSEERRKGQGFVSEIASLRDQLSTMHMVTGARTGLSAEGPSGFAAGGRASPQLQVDFDEEFEDVSTLNVLKISLGATKNSTAPAPEKVAAEVITGEFDFENDQTPLGVLPVVPPEDSFGVNDEDTAPGGHLLPADFSGIKAPSKKQEANRSAAGNLNSTMLKDLAGIPSLPDDEVIFVDDD